MKTMKRSCMAVLLIAAVFLLNAFRVFAFTTNSYHGINYNSSKEDVEEYEQILKDEGYLCVTKGCSDRPEWTERLLSNTTIAKDTGAYLNSTGEDYKFYVSEFDYNAWSSGRLNDVKFLSACYAVDYYIFNHELEVNDRGLVGEEAVAAGYDTGWLTVYMNVDDDLRSRPDLIYSIILKGNSSGFMYDLSTSAFSANNYVMRFKIPTETYSVYSITVDNEHIVDLSANESEQFTIRSGVNHDLYVSFKRIQESQEIASGEMATHNAGNETIGTSQTLMEDGMVIDPLEAQVEKGPSPVAKLIPVICFGVVAVLGLIAFLIIAKRMKERNGEIG